MHEHMHVNVHVYMYTVEDIHSATAKPKFNADLGIRVIFKIKYVGTWAHIGQLPGAMIHTLNNACVSAEHM